MSTPTKSVQAEIHSTKPLLELSQKLAMISLEALQGTRTVEQLAPFTTPHATDTLRVQAQLWRERRAITRQMTTSTYRVGNTHLIHIAENTYEAVVMLHGSARSRVAAMRLEVVRDRWRASAINVM